MRAAEIPPNRISAAISIQAKTGRRMAISGSIMSRVPEAWPGGGRPLLPK
jgi:hypothetical protein